MAGFFLFGKKRKAEDDIGGESSHPRVKLCDEAQDSNEEPTTWDQSPKAEHSDAGSSFTVGRSFSGGQEDVSFMNRCNAPSFECQFRVLQLAQQEDEAALVESEYVFERGEFNSSMQRPLRSVSTFATDLLILY